MPVSLTISSAVVGLGFMLDETGDVFFDEFIDEFTFDAGAQILDEAGDPIGGDHPSGDVTITVAAASVTISISED